jgi:hypothetical protein
VATSQTGRAIVNVGIKVAITNWLLPNQTKIPTAGDPPKIIQIIDNGKEFQFPYRPLPIQHEGYGPEFSEIERPYDKPLLEIKSGKLRRFTFEVPLAIFDDSMVNNVDENMERLKEIADDGIPVRFQKMPVSITSSNWYISELSFSQDRTLRNGPTTRFTASMGFVEYTPYRPKFVFLRPISYGVPKKVSKKASSVSQQAFDKLSVWSVAVAQGKTPPTPTPTNPDYPPD